MQEEQIKLIRDVIHNLNKGDYSDHEVLIDAKNKLKLYANRFMEQPEGYLESLASIDTNPDQPWLYKKSNSELKSIASTMMRDIELSEINSKKNEREKYLEMARLEIDEERKKIQNDAGEIRALNEKLNQERQQLLAQEEKFNEFKQKLELADKNLDFQSESVGNKKSAKFWGILASILIIVTIISLLVSLDSIMSFSDINNAIQNQYSGDTNHDILSIIIYFSFGKYIFTKILLYTLMIYASVFCIKNYNAQMHNMVVNNHKANALKSTLTLLNTAKSEDGNDKLLIQATQAIFGHQQTGYHGADNEPSSPNLVTNVIETFGKKI